MRDTITKIQFIEAENTNDISYYSAGSIIPITQITTKDLKDVDILIGKSSLVANQTNETYGIIHEVAITALISTKKDSNRALVNYLSTKDCVYIVTTASGARKIIGSQAYPARATYDEETTDLTSTYYTLNITNTSPHGIFIAK